MFKYLFAKHAEVRAQDIPAGATEFTYHKKTAMPALLGGLLLVAVVEAVALHIVIAMWSHWIAILATLSTVCVGIQIVAQIRAVTLRPIFFANGSLMLRNGAFDVADVPIDRISQIEATTKLTEQADTERKPINVGFPASHNVVLQIDSPMDAKILNRSHREFDTALLALDEPREFVDFVKNQKIGNTPTGSE